MVHTHPVNRGYGANQKTCYQAALDAGADIVVMVHPDYQYTPKLIPAMASLVGNGLYACVLGSRILGGFALQGGMPLWKYLANRFLTFAENLLLGVKISEYHTGYRAFSRQLLERLPLQAGSDDFVFDNQVLAQIVWLGETIAEVSCPTRYEPESSSINFKRSVVYGFGLPADCAGVPPGQMGSDGLEPVSPGRNGSGEKRTQCLASLSLHERPRTWCPRVRGAFPNLFLGEPRWDATWESAWH